MRLAKYLARAGVASRRRAEEFIRAGRVCVNGTVIDRPQARVHESDAVTVDGTHVQGFEEKVHLLLHKPPGYISTVYDTHHRPTVMDLVKETGKRLYPVGRLDADTSGVLLMTNDGELANLLTHPRYGVRKVYLARVSGLPDKKALEQLRNGVDIEGRKTAPAGVKIARIFSGDNEALLEITLIEGRKRQVKIMCEAVNHPVIKLHRKEFAGLRAGRLPEGSYRRLTEEEVRGLYRRVES